MRYSLPRHSRRLSIVIAVVAAAGVAVIPSAARDLGSSAPGPRSLATLEITSDEVRDRDIEFYHERVKRDPSGAFDLARLSALYLQRSRESGDWRDAAQAESLSRRSLRNRRERNDAAAQVLASSLLTQHRFDEALEIARGLRDRNPTLASMRAMVAEIQMELGMYDSARVAFDSLESARGDLTVAPRLARWAEVDGRSDDARRLMRHSLALARRDPRTPREQIAWFWLRLGDIELRAGRFRAADSAYKAGLAARSNDYRLLSALARLAAVETRWSDAIQYGDQAIAQNFDPATLGILADAHVALGDTARGREYARALDVAVRSQPDAYHRAWSLFLLDHGRQTATVTRKINAELKTRRDIYGYDLLAWSLYKQGRYADARRSMTRALAQGTRDAQLFYHAGRIEQATGNTRAADSLLAQARALNPSLK
jgi:tetratricopeptide (TPR) repeat protein